MGIIISVSGNKNTEITINGKKVEVKDKIKKEKWRAYEEDIYNYINSSFEVKQCIDTRSLLDNERYELGNYFPTMKEAYRKLDKILEILKQ